jgi:hypothetical protein
LRAPRRSPIIGHTVLSMFDGRRAPGGERMKRSVPAALGVAIVALAVPAAALATHHHGFGPRHHHGHGYVHQGATDPSGPTGSNSVSSYSDGTLVLTLADGDTLTGAVTDGTRFVCIGQGWDGRGFGRGGRRGGRYNWGRDGGPTGATGATGWSGPTGPTGAQGGTGTGGSGGGRGWGGRGGSSSDSHWTAPPPCDSSLLVSGTQVSSAEVEITPGGVLFGEIVLLPAVQ